MLELHLTQAAVVRDQIAKEKGRKVKAVRGESYRKSSASESERTKKGIGYVMRRREEVYGSGQ